MRIGHVHCRSVPAVIFSVYSWTYSIFVVSVTHFACEVNREITWSEAYVYIYGLGLMQVSSRGLQLQSRLTSWPTAAIPIDVMAYSCNPD